MKKIVFIIFILITIFLTNCGSGSSDAGKKLLSQILTIVGIPQNMIVNICQDGNNNGFCDSIELSYVSLEKINFLAKIILGENNHYELKNYDPNKKIIMELQSEDMNYNDGNFSLEYRGTSTELSILQSMVDANDISSDEVKDVNKMEGKDTFYDVLLGSMIKNLNGYMNNDMEHKSAREVNLKELGRVFKEDIPLKKLSKLIKEQCKDDIDCRRELIKKFPVNLNTDEQNIYDIARKRRRVKLVNDKLIESFECKDSERKIIKHYGFEDIFNLKNRREQAHPTRRVFNIIGKAKLANYDENESGKLFAEDVRRLPRRITKGRFFIGLEKRDGRVAPNNKIHIGEYKKENADKLFSAKLTTLHGRGWSHQTVNNANPTTEIYYNDFKNIIFRDNNDTLLDYLDRRNRFDVVVGRDTSVDFISVAICSKKDKEAEIKQTLNIFKCKEGERLIKIIGGSVDAFATGEEKKATPSELLLSTIDRPTIEYDELSNNKFFLDTLNRPTDLTITDAQFSIGIKPLKNFLYQNDTINIGSYEFGKYAKFQLYGFDENSVSNMWKRDILISNGERVLQTNLADINITKGGDGSILDMLKNSDSLLDILVQNDTSVDFSYLNLCVKK